MRRVVRAIRKSLEDNVSDLAAAIAYWALFAIFPLLLGVLSLAGHSLDSADVQARIYELMEGLLPGTADLVQENLESVVRYRSGLGIAGILGLLWTASKGLAAITRAVNIAQDAKPSRSFVVSKLRFFAMTVIVTVLFTVSITLTVAFEFLLRPKFVTSMGFEQLNMPKLQSWSASFLFIFLTLAMIYKVTPYVETRWRQVLPGAFLASVLFALGQAGFVLYLDRMTRFEAIYGSLSSIFVLLVWLYFSAIVLILGAEYNIVRWQAQSEPPDP